MDRDNEGRKRHAPATERNREPILEVLRRVLPDHGVVLEIASGSGQHGAWLAPRLPHLEWQPSDRDASALASISAWAGDAAGGTVRPPLLLDAEAENWELGDLAPRITALVAINLIHIAPWSVAQGLLAGAGRLLPAGGVLYMYGPYRRDGRHTAPSNARFDAGLRAENPDWGVRDLEAVTAEAEANGLTLTEVVDMPANNLSLIFGRRDS